MSYLLVKRDMVNIIKEKYSYLYFSLLVIIVIFYSLYYAPYGYNDADDGYTLALSWRIFKGEVPYRDFIMVRPPLSPLFHALFLYFIPENYQFFSERVIMYIMMAVSALFSSFSIDKAFKFDKIGINKYFFACISFVFSVHNFPPMPWHTIDAIFFASIGIYMLHFNSLCLAIIGIIFLLFSALCKQPFYLIPFIGIFLYMNKSNNIKNTAIITCVLQILILTFFCFLFYTGSFFNFIKDTSGSLDARDLLFAGLIRYVSFNPIYVAIPVILWGYSRFTKISASYIPYLFALMLMLFPLVMFIKKIFIGQINDTFFFSDKVAHILFLITGIFLAYNILQWKKWITLWALMSISWCASISWGYLTPVLFSAPFLYGFFLISNIFFRVKDIKKMSIYIFILGLSVYFIAYQKPYCNPQRKFIHYRMDNIFSKLKFIYAGKETYVKYSEVSFLIKKYGYNFKVMPGMPLVDYLVNQKPKSDADWMLNAEINNKELDIIDSLSKNNVIVFLEKEPQLSTVLNTKNKFNSSVAYLIKNNWKQVEVTNFFEVYRKK